MKYRLQCIIFVLVAFMLGCNEFMVVGVLSNIAESYHASLSAVGLLVTMYALTYAICTPILTTITGKYDRFKVLMTLMVVFFLGNGGTEPLPPVRFPDNYRRRCGRHYFADPCLRQHYRSD